MKIANEFTVGVPIDRAWAVLTDLEGIAPCLPGAQLTGVDGDVYRGKVKVKVGPVISEFAGTARFAEKDDAAHRAVIDAKGRDARSAGNAAAMITAQLRPDGDRTAVTVDTDLKISGKLAQFGSSMIKEVSEKLLGQFVTALEAKIAADEAGGDGAATATQAATPTAGDAARPAGTINGSPVVDAAGVADTADTSGVTTGDAGASRDIAAAREVAGDEAPLSETTAEEHPDTPLLTPRGDSPLATVEDATAPRKEGDAAALMTTEGGASVPSKDFETTAEPAPLDLMELAGGSIRKRVVPVVVGAAVIVAAIVVWRIVR